MSHKYPRIGGQENRDKNICAKCRCGQLGKRKIHIQVSWFRGEDEVVWSCMDHRHDAEYLLGEGPEKKAEPDYHDDTHICSRCGAKTRGAGICRNCTDDQSRQEY